MTSPLDAIPPPRPATRQRLHAALARRADDDGLLDVAYRVVESPIGDLLVAATPRGVARVAFDCEDHQAVLETLSTSISPRVLHAPARLDHVARALEQYFLGRLRTFEVTLDWCLSDGFRREVLERLTTVGYGHTVSYGELARGVSRPGAARAVGTACATNPIPVFVPCHRVVRADGTIGEYRGGRAAKAHLLEMEGVRHS